MGGIFIDIIMLYYLFVLIFVGIGGSLTVVSDFDILSQSMLKQIFMYQYVVYKLASEHLNLAGIIILEILTTLSVWFLNIIIFLFICLWHILSAIWDLFYFCFKKR
jgi:hypothetical protein